MRTRKLGYDIETLYTEEELFDMYIKEGRPPDEARRLASSFYPQQRDLFWRSKYFWEKVQEHESPGRFDLEEDAE
jgi:hypothetical protein